jgi:hypothetical protein
MKPTDKPEVTLSDGWEFVGYLDACMIARGSWVLSTAGVPRQFEAQEYGEDASLLMIQPVSRERQFEAWLEAEIAKTTISPVATTLFQNVLAQFRRTMKGGDA